jgi:glycosyltransferase involved in cell wall biosynthesis
MGKDVVWDNKIYRAIVHPPLRRASRVLAISHATRDSTIGFGVRSERVHVVRLGVEIPPITPNDAVQARDSLRNRLAIPGQAVVLLAFGRLVRRKGVAWFVSEVLPQLNPQTILLIAGDGEDRPAVEEAIAASGAADRVRMLGQVSDHERDELMAGADLMVQPNIHVHGDMEGFGLVTVEAAMRFTPVVAADLEGLRDAVIDSGTGFLLPSGVAETWVQRLNELMADREKLSVLGEQFGATCREEYSRTNLGTTLRARLGLGAQSGLAAP